MKFTLALLAACAATVSAAVEAGACEIVHQSNGNHFKLDWRNIDESRMGSICSDYEAALHQYANAAGKEHTTKVLEYSCVHRGNNSIQVDVKMDKQSCAVQASALRPALVAAVGFSVDVPNHICQREIDAGKC
ncbi:hypothetical protein N0V95_004849 [Ascochyta clinopodiicola]|nr:hypothetical protein N0V95_004849 [Ascochyta clinopodiicola]